MNNYHIATRRIIQLSRIILLLSLSIPVLAATQDLQPIYDAKKFLKTAKISAKEEAVIKRSILPVAARYWKNRGKDCDAEFEVIDAAPGSFTRASSMQKAILYRYCITGHNFALNGIAVIENGGVAAHIAYEGAWDHAIGALPDINGNGLSKILIATGGTSTATVWGVITIIELREHGVQKFGNAETVLDSCMVDEKNGYSTAYKLWVKPGSVPDFYRETYRQGCAEKSNWVRKGSLKKIQIRKDNIVYDRLK